MAQGAATIQLDTYSAMQCVSAQSILVQLHTEGVLHSPLHNTVCRARNPEHARTKALQHLCSYGQPVLHW